MRSSGPFFSTLSIAMLVDSRKKLNINWPMIKKQREILNAIPALVEQRAEHSPHDKAGQQRVEHAPGNAQHAAAVLELKNPA